MEDKSKSPTVAVEAISPGILESGDESSKATSETPTRFEKLKEAHGVRDTSVQPVNW